MRRKFLEELTVGKFSQDEIFEMAVAREADANRLYLSLAQRVTDPNMRKIFEELAAEELEHKAKLELEIMKEGKVVDTDRIPLSLLEGQPDYMPSEFDLDYKGILLMGMKKEETSFRLYVELAGIVTDQDAKELLLALAEEEVKHKLRFQAVFNHVLKDK